MPAPLHRIQLQWQGGVALDLEWTKGRGTTTSLAETADDIVYLEAEADPDNATISGIPPICYRSDTPSLFECLQLRENTDYFVDITLPISRDLAEREVESHSGWPFGERLARVFLPDPPRRWRTNDKGHLIVSGTLRLRNHAGILDLRTRYGGGRRFEVVCQKIGYLDEFRTLLDRVADELAELLLQYDSPVSAGFSINDVSSANESGLLFQLRHVMAPENLPSSIEEILGRFSVKLLARHSFIDLEDVEEPDIETLATELDITELQPGGPLRRFFGGYTPRRIPVQEQSETADTPENRYIKYFLEEVLLLSTRLRDRLNIAGKHASSREAGAWVEQIDDLLSNRHWKKVGPFRQFPSNSQVLQKGRGYRDILRFDLSLRMGLELPWKRAEELAEGTYGDLRPVNELYEYWCFFVLRKTLLELCLKEQPNKGTLIQTSPDGLKVSLRKGRRSKTSYIYKETPDTKIEVNLFYNRRFSRPNKPLTSWLGSYTANFDPDYSIEIIKMQTGSVQRHWLHFDAKYRLDRADFDKIFADEQKELLNDDRDESEYDQELRRVHKREDLFKMHTYRDGILGSRGAYVLFPGDDDVMFLNGKQQNLFVRHPSAFGGAPSIKYPSVGAFSLSPGTEVGQQANLSAFIREVFESLATSNSYVEETASV